MRPSTHFGVVIEDDGLENRKTAYETMYTLVSLST
jgi:hypothetical protein